MKRTDSATNSSGPSESSSKIGTSCAECRRSKLKCDRSFPCQSCIRRGCANICPDGTMAATKGNKALLVRAQKLTEEVDELKSRIHELEAALENARLNDINQDDGPSFDPSSLSMQADEPTNSEVLSTAIKELVAAFPLGKKDHKYPLTIFQTYVPQKQVALQPICLFYQKASYVSCPVLSNEFFTEILSAIYSNGEEASLHDIPPHSLSVFFATMALGSLCDNADDSKEQSDRYHNLARAALAFQSLSTNASCATIQAVFLVTRLTQKAHACVSEECWLLNGINNRLIHKLGFHNDKQASAQTDRERESARRVFWEVVTWDAWACFISDRPGYFSLKHVNCPFPTNTRCEISGKDSTWSIWRYKFTTNCVTLTLDYTLSYQDPPYSAIIDVDNIIRSFPLPVLIPAYASQTGTFDGWSSDPFTAAEEFSALAIVESTSICLHKKYFLQAMRLNPEDPFATEYQFSIRTTLHSAGRIIVGMIKMYQQHASEINLTWTSWSALYMATNVLRDLATRCPRCPMAKPALQLYEKAMALFEDAMSGVADDILATLRAFFGKACGALSMAVVELDDIHNNSQVQNPVSDSEAPLIPQIFVPVLPDSDPLFNPFTTLDGQFMPQQFPDPILGATWQMPENDAASLNLLPESIYDPSIYVPESQFGYQHQWDATQQWEDFVAGFKSH